MGKKAEITTGYCDNIHSRHASEGGERIKKINDDIAATRKDAMEKKWSEKKLNRKLAPKLNDLRNWTELKTVADGIINGPVVFEYSTNSSTLLKDEDGRTTQISDKKVLIIFRVGKKAALVHENRHGWGILNNEISMYEGYDYQDEYEAYRHQKIFDPASVDKFVTETAKEEYPNIEDASKRDLYNIEKAIEFKYKYRVQYRTWFQVCAD